MSSTRKPLFTVIGTVAEIDGRKRWVPNSKAHYLQQLSDIPDGTRLAAVFEEFKATRSDQQLAYHFVLIGYLARHCGYTKDEMHDAVVRLKFGERQVSIGDRTVAVRRSVSESAKMPKDDMMALIEYDLQLCEDLGVRVPSMEELGYISNHDTPGIGRAHKAAANDN